jgi:tRNA A-37 threonylcarbamoyl transferase component Bud32
MSLMDQVQAGDTSDNGGAFDADIDAFESAWRSGDPPEIRSIIDKVPPELRASLLHELIRVDLEYRWKNGSLAATNGRPWAFPRYKIEDYATRYPELGDPSKPPLDLIVEEFRVRQRWGDQPDAAEFAQRFPDRGQELTAELLAVAQELQTEFEPPPELSTDSSSVMAGLDHVPQFDYHDFVLEAHLGSGGIGKVYRAWWKSRRRHVAIKMLRKSWRRQPGAEELFFREAEILVRLRHPRIVSVQGIGRTPGGGCFLVIDLVGGGDLSQRTERQVPVAQAIQWAAQAAEGLAFAHREGVVHRDLKPSNLLLDSRGGVLVADFGLALVLSARDVVADSLVGTLAYMAPEQLFSDGRQIGPAADVFGLGAVLHELLAGRPPDEGCSLAGLVERRLASSPRVQLRSLRPDLPDVVEKVVARCLAAEPAERFSAAELAETLRRLGSGQ